MNKVILLSVLVVFGLGLFSGCASIKTWPDYERTAENKMAVIQEKIGEGLKTGSLTPDQSQAFLTTLKDIQIDYTALRDKRVYRDEWDNLDRRLDLLEDEIDQAMTRAGRMEEPRNDDRIAALQRKIDDLRYNRRLSERDAAEYQSRLDYIRRDYLRMTDQGRYTEREEGSDISHRLDLLEADLDRLR